MKPTNKAKKSLARMAASRKKEVRQRLSLHDQAAKAERELYDTMAVANAARKFWEQSQKAFKAAAGVSALERAEAVSDAAKKFWEQSTNAVADAQQALDAARDELIDYNDRRAKQCEAQAATDLSVLYRWAEAYAAQMKKKAETKRAVTIARKREPKRRGKVVSSVLIPTKSAKKK
jgi:exonuclease VII small subunit